MSNTEHEEEDEGTDKQPRLSFYFESSSIKSNSNREKILDEIDRIEQLITLNLQKINENLVNSNNLISNKIVTKLLEFNNNSTKIYNNISHIKEFFENAANVNILTKKDIDVQNIDNTYVNTTINNNSSSFIINDDSIDQITGNISTNSNNSTESKDIKDRYKQNFNLSSNNDNINEGNDNDNNNNNDRDDPTVSKFKRIPIFLNDNNNSLHTESILRDLQLNIDDESTGKQIKRQKVEKPRGLDKGKDKDFELNDSEKETVKEETEINNNYVKDIIAGYESPPWEEPPVLESIKFNTSSDKKRLDAENDSIIENEDNFINIEKRDISNEGNNQEEEEEEISIRFPSSPKYGAGGKLLRSDKGREIALDFARSEIIANHPILSLQQDKVQTKKTDNVRNIREITKNFENNYDTSNSTFDDTPELLSESLNRRRENKD